VVRRALLITELRTLRYRHRYAESDIAQALGWASGRLARAENWTPRTPIEDLIALLDFYGVGSADKGRLQELATEALEPAWWEPYLEGWHDLEFAEYLAYEGAALSIEAVELLNVPALLQTGDYSRHVLTAHWPNAPRERIDALAGLRQQRQRMIAEEARRDVTQVYLLDETVIRHRVGPPQVMAQQIEKILDAADRVNVTVQILSPSALQTSAKGPFWLLETEQGIDDVLHLERTPRSSTYIGASLEFADYRVAFAELREGALSPSRSSRLLERAYAEWASEGA
jgi:hypothetical protein